MLHILQTALELGFLYALIPMALFLSFRVLDIADMTTDGCFVLGTPDIRSWPFPRLWRQASVQAS